MRFMPALSCIERAVYLEGDDHHLPLARAGIVEEVVRMWLPLLLASA
jgi:hypothetical protein